MTDEHRSSRKDEAAPSRPALGKWIGLGVGAGIGSAAVAAALLYASRSGKAKTPAKR